jgi:hypothetical protein
MTNHKHSPHGSPLSLLVGYRENNDDCMTVFNNIPDTSMSAIDGG